MPGPSDEALLAAAADGDGAAYGEFVRRYQRPVLAFVARFLGRAASAAAEDVAQDVFLRAWRAAGDFSPRARVSTWLFRIATNTCLNHRRDNRRQSSAGLAPEPLDPRDSADALVAGERAARVQAAVGSLPERQRVALLLSHFEQMTYAEISDILGVSVGAVESLLVRARVALRAALAEPDSPQESAGSRVEPDRSR